MVAQRIMSLIIQESATRSDHQAFPVFTILYCSYTFCAVCSGHKLDAAAFEMNGVGLLRINRLLVAGGRSTADLGVMKSALVTSHYVTSSHTTLTFLQLAAVTEPFEFALN